MENLKKANRLANIFPEETVISSGGVPFDITIKIPKKGEENIEYTISITNEKGKKLIQKIRESAKTASIIFLATDTSSRGEAIAHGIWEEVGELQYKMHRLHLQSLEREAVKTEVLEEEKRAEKTECNPNKAASYWVRSVMDITWKNKVSPWLEEAAKVVRTICKTDAVKTPTSLSRTQCSILHLLSHQESSKTNYRGYKYWEVHALLSGSIPGTILEAHICVPNLLLLQNESDRVTKKIWEEKMAKNLQAVREGKAIPQKEPGNPWRFETENDASLYRHHLKRYPLVTVLQVETWEEEEEPKPAHNTESILETGLVKQWAKQTDISETLDDLFLGGLITHPKTESENLSEAAFQAMWAEAAKQGKTLVHKKRAFPKNPENQEAIRPTRWEKTPKNAEQEIQRCTKPPKANLAIQLYKEIYERAWQSQTPAKKLKNIQITTTGPLHVTAEEAFYGEATAKENIFKALMNFLMCGKIKETGETPLQNLQKNSVMQAIKIRIEEKETQNPGDMDKEQLLLSLQKAKLGKLETLCSLIPKLEEAALIQTKEDGKIILTESGKITINLLNEYIGSFIHQKYHEVVENQLKEIERGNNDPAGFLQYWWKTLCEVTNTLPPIPEAVADSSGKTLLEVEKQLQNEKYSTSQAGFEKTA